MAKRSRKSLKKKDIERLENTSGVSALGVDAGVGCAGDTCVGVTVCSGGGTACVMSGSCMGGSTACQGLATVCSGSNTACAVVASTSELT